MPNEQKAWECPLCYGTIGPASNLVTPDQPTGHRDRCKARHLTQAPAAPMVHMNGTGWTDLYAQIETAVHALNAAEKAMYAAGPNGRDYYMQPTGTMERAQAEHYSRLERLAGVKAELEIVWMAISDQEASRGNR